MPRAASGRRAVALAVSIAALVELVSACTETAGTTAQATSPSTTLVTSVDAVERVTPVGFELVDVTITSAEGLIATSTMWLADEPVLWGRGLTDVTDLGNAAGMLFSFERPANYQFVMWQTPMPLDIVFFDEAGTFVGEVEMEPCVEGLEAQCPRYSPGAPFLAAIEVPVGSLDALHVGNGTRLTFELADPSTGST